MTAFRAIDRVYSRLLTIIDAFTALMVFLLMFLITTDVVARTVFNHPFQGVSEIVSNSIIILCFLEIPYVLMRGSHVRSTLMYDRLGVRGKCLIDLLACALGIIIYVLIIKSSWGNLIKAIQINDAEIAGSIRITTIPGRLSIIVGSALMTIEFVILAIKNLVKLKDPDAFPEDTAPAEGSGLE